MSCADCGQWAHEDCTSTHTIGNLTNVFDIDITLFGSWHNKVFDFNSHQWCVNLPRGARQFAKITPFWLNLTFGAKFVNQPRSPLYDVMYTCLASDPGATCVIAIA